jgi:hypothetical protein
MWWDGEVDVSEGQHQLQNIGWLIKNNVKLVRKLARNIKHKPLQQEKIYISLS